MVTDDLETGLRPHKKAFFDVGDSKNRLSPISENNVRGREDDAGDSKNRLSPICHHDKALIINNLDVNGDR